MGRLVAAILLFALVLPLPAAQAAAPQRFLVSFHDAPPAAGSVLGAAHVLESFAFARVALVEAPASARAVLATLPGVAGVYDDEPITLEMERERSIIDADPPAGASRWPTGSNVTIALVDSGIDSSHPAFAGRVAAAIKIARSGVVSASEGDSDGHGTHVAGIVAGDGAMSVNGRHHGVAPAAHLIGVDISDSFTTTNAVRAFAWISENAQKYDIRVVSNSWGREKSDAHYDPDDPVIRASDALVEQGIVVVFSAGNRGRDGSSTLTTEAMDPNVITVGAASGTGRAESYSSRGPAIDGSGARMNWVKPDIMAPGTGVVSARASVIANNDARTDEERYYTVMNGTSMAAPQVAGAAALILDLEPSLTPPQVQSLLQRTAADLGASGPDDDTGYGMLDVATALQEAAYASQGERRVVVETQVPVHAEGSVASAAGAIVLSGTSANVPPASAITIPLKLPTGASSTDLWFNWSGQGSFDARLVGPDGPLVFERVDPTSLHVTAPVAPGNWRVEATVSSPAAYSPYVLSGSITVREEHVLEIASDAHGHVGRGSSAFPAESSAGARPLDVLSKAPWLVLALAATTTTAVAVGLRKR